MTEVDEPTLQLLCVDDEMSILRSLNRVLMDEDCEVLTANSGAEALEILAETTDLALIISDQRMPEMTGVEFLQQAKEIRPDAYRVMLTGYADINATMDAVNKGEIWRYITKPWDDEQLILLVRDALKHYNLQRENQRLQGIVQRQNEELKEWNDRLKQRVLAQTDRIREKHEELARSNKYLRDSFEQTLLSFSCLIELRDKKMRNHSFNTAAISEHVAQKLRLSPEECRDIRAAALLHGIGKLGLPDDLLLKPESELTPDEKRIYNSFSVRGQTAIDPIVELRQAGIIIRHLMENYDGSGSPDRLKGTDIPIGSRIIRLAEHIDRQLCAGRYGTLEQIIESCEGQLGSTYDPKLLTRIGRIAQEYYSGAEQAEGHSTRRELYPEALEPGMVVLRDVFSGTGLLLLKQGSVLSDESIRSLKRYYDTDTPKSAVLVLSAE
ncbi:MAG: phosphohydrolase [Desulfuromonas sp.]|nr:MAG: phosphohydrolase [Desulfuromonas sp.]